jgi:hypothetical protein
MAQGIYGSRDGRNVVQHNGLDQLMARRTCSFPRRSGVGFRKGHINKRGRMYVKDLRYRD